MPVLLTRRLLMLGTVAGIGASVLPHRVAAAVAEGRAGRRGAVPCVLDSSVDQFMQLRAAANRAGMVVSEFSRDVGMLAMHVDAGWHLARSPLCGITLPSSFFILEQIARRHGMVAVVVGEHSRGNDGSWRHALREQTSTVHDWRGHVCDVLHEASRQSLVPHKGPPVRSVSLCEEAARGPLRLLSWSIVADA